MSDLSQLQTAFECPAPSIAPGGTVALTLRPGLRTEPFELTVELLDEDEQAASPQQQQQQQQHRTQVGVRVEAREAHLFYRRPNAAAVVLATSRKGGFARCRRHGACFWLSYDAVGSRMLRYGRGYEVEAAVLAEASVPFLLPLVIPGDGEASGGSVEVEDDPLTREPSARLLRVGGAFESAPVAASPHVARLSARRAGGQHSAAKAPSSAAAAAPAPPSHHRGRRAQAARPPSVSVASRPLTLTPAPLALPPGAPCSLLSLGDPKSPVRFEELPSTCRTLVAALCSPGLELEWPGTPQGTLVAAISRSLRCGVLKEALEKKAARAVAAAGNRGGSRPASAVASPSSGGPGAVPARPRTPVVPPPALPYLRVAVAPATRSAPGEPFVLEIWPAGCCSPIHSHGGACGAFRVLHGSCTLSLFNASGADGDSSSDDDDDNQVDGNGNDESENSGQNGHADNNGNSTRRRIRSPNRAPKNRYARKPHFVGTCTRGDVGWFDSGHHQTHSIGADPGPPGSFCATLQAFRYADDDDAQLPFMEVEPAAAAAAAAARKRRRRAAAAAEAEAAAAAAASLAASASGGSLASAPSRPVPPPAPADFSPVSDFQFAEMARLVLAEFEAIEEWSRSANGNGCGGEGMDVETAGAAAAAAAKAKAATAAAAYSSPPRASQAMYSSDDDDSENAAELDTFDWCI